jgi:streptogramin lyase
VWVGSIGDNDIVRINPRTNRVTGIVAGINGPRQIAAIGSDLWVAEFNAPTVAEVHPSS